MSTRWHNALPSPVAFVFSGGAALGAIQVGMLKALQTHGIYPDLITGTSVGALNGAVIADHGLKEGISILEQLWYELKDGDAFPGGRLTHLRHLISQRTSIYSNHGLHNIIKRTLRSTRFEQLQLPFGALAANVMNNHGAMFHQGDLHKALLASSAIPGVYPPVKIGDQHYVDGAMVANLPLRFALKMGAKSIVALDAGEMCHRRELPTSILDMYLTMMGATLRQRVRIEAPQCAKQVPLLYLPTPCSLNRNMTDFSQGAAMMAAGESISDAFLQESPIPTVGSMCGAPHFHNHEPQYQLTEMMAA